MSNLKKSVLALGMTALLPAFVQADCGKEGCAAATQTKVSTAECAATCSTGDACCAAETAAPAKFTKVEYKIDGMTCAGCSIKVNNALTQIKGVKVEKVCHEGNVAAVSYDRSKVKDRDVIAAINKTGFKVKAEMIEVKVDGMTCAGCSTKVGNALTKIDGVKEQKVCHVSKHALVEFDPSKVSSDKIIAAINQTGFKVVE